MLHISALPYRFDHEHICLIICPSHEVIPGLCISFLAGGHHTWLVETVLRQLISCNARMSHIFYWSYSFQEDLRAELERDICFLESIRVFKEQ